jgi:hypothetical protein
MKRMLVMLLVVTLVVAGLFAAGANEKTLSRRRPSPWQQGMQLAR